MSRKKPLHEQLVDVLRDKIEHELAPGDMLPSERELTEQFGVSRTTVRLALAELESLGMVQRRHGKGSFVLDVASSAANLSQAYSFTDHMRSIGRVPETTVLEFAEMDADEHLARRVGVSVGDALFKVKRLRSADGVPMMVERSYLPARVFPGLSFELLSRKPLYEIMEEDYRQKIRFADEEFYASVVRSNDAGLLKIGEGAPVLDLVRTTYNVRNRVVEYTLSVARGDQFRYRVTHHRA